MEFTIDTNAGPILTRRADNPDEIKSYMEDMIPMLKKRGYTHTWSTSGDWHVINIRNSKGRLVHAAAFCPSRTLRSSR